MKIHTEQHCLFFDDKSTKLKVLMEQDLDFHLLYEIFLSMRYTQSLVNVKAENSQSFDLGFEKSFFRFGFKY